MTIAMAKLMDGGFAYGVDHIKELIEFSTNVVKT